MLRAELIEIAEAIVHALVAVATAWCGDCLSSPLSWMIIDGGDPGKPFLDLPSAFGVGA